MTLIWSFVGITWHRSKRRNCRWTSCVGPVSLLIIAWLAPLCAIPPASPRRSLPRPVDQDTLQWPTRNFLHFTSSSSEILRLSYYLTATTPLLSCPWTIRTLSLVCFVSALSATFFPAQATGPEPLATRYISSQIDDRPP
jgi:hypothetical protein